MQQNNTPTTDDQELAEMLANLTNDKPAASAPAADVAAPAPNPVDPTDGMQFEATPPVAPAAQPVQFGVPTPAAPTEAPAPAATMPTISTHQTATVGVTSPLSQPAANTSADAAKLEEIKQDALEDLRPLVDKLDLPADEKFDTMLLIIRSTDDQSLLQPAYETAKLIADDTRRAQALLDIIKEIDFFGNPQV